MSYDIVETSLFDSSPVELYEFTRTVTNWRYTNSDEDIIVDGASYTSAQIKRTNIEQNQDPGRNPITLTVPRDLEFVKQYRNQPPSDVIDITVKRTHRTDGDNEVVVLWIGRLLNVKFTDSECKLICEPIFTAMQRPSSGRVWQTNCPYALYETGCNLAASSFQTNANVTVNSEFELQATVLGTFVDGYFTGGFANWIVDGETTRRTILTHVGEIITVQLPFVGITTGNEVQFFAGCDRSLNTCINKFNNVVNYGGNPFKPDKNIFEGNIPLA